MQKNLFIVTSALEPRIGVISKEDRFEQTIDTLKNLKEKVPDAVILFTDGSPVLPDEKNRQEISKYINAGMYWSEDSQIKDFANFGKKSEAEIILLMKTLMMIKRNPELSRLLFSIKRIFKYSARSLLTDDFKISIYNNSKLFGKYVFKQRIPTWMNDKENASHLLITRFFSFCPSLFDNYLLTLQNILNSCMKYGLDTEHGHFKEIDKKYLVELNKVYCKGIMAGTGKTEVY